MYTINIIHVIKAQRIRWLGYVKTMTNHRIAKNVLTTRDGGKKRRGRPRKRWLQAVKENL